MISSACGHYGPEFMGFQLSFLLCFNSVDKLSFYYKMFSAPETYCFYQGCSFVLGYCRNPGTENSAGQSR